jgi:hypothetical protein
MVASLLWMAGVDWAVPDYTTLCRRQRTLAVQIPYRRADGPLNLLIDSTGIKFSGDGEWQARKHGVQGRRQWRKVHLAMDTATSDIRAVEFTPSSDGDSPMLPELLDHIAEGEEIGTVTADGAYDTRRCHTAIIDRQATAIIPIRKNGRACKEDCPAAIARNETLHATRHYGRAFWKRWTGYQPEAGSRPRCAASKPSAHISRQDTPTAKPPKSRYASHSSTASTHPGPPRSSAWADDNGERGSHA